MRKDLGNKTVIYPMPVLIIGSYDEDANPNAMNAAWGGIYDYHQVTVSLGAHVSTDNIRKSKAFTISFATVETVKEADYVGLISQAKQKDKLTKAGLHPFKSEKVNAPLFKEFPLTLECELVSLDGNLGEGGTLVGNIINVSADESILTNGKVDLNKFHPITFDGLNNKYIALGEEVADAFKIGLSLK